MSDPGPFPLIAVDVGNARAKLGLFRCTGGARLPEPEATFSLVHGTAGFEALAEWLSQVTAGLSHAQGLRWCIGSVNRPGATSLVDWVRTRRPQDNLTLLAAGDLPLVVSLERPDMVGIDRLLDALAANRLRSPQRPAVVVDVGTAITVDLVSAAGAFLGGSILPGIAMSARALHEFTDLLPWLDMTDLTVPPPALGTATVPAMRSGLFWGAIGAIRELVHELAGDSDPHVFLTGGAGVAVAELLAPAACYVPNLTLAGICIAACSMPLRP